MMHSASTNPLRRAVPPRCLTLLTVQQAANSAAVSKQTVRRWIRAGHLRVLRAGRQIRIDESDLVRLPAPRRRRRHASIIGGGLPDEPRRCSRLWLMRWPPLAAPKQCPQDSGCFGRQKIRPNDIPWLPLKMGTRRPSDEALWPRHPDPGPAEAASRSTGQPEGGGSIA
jgi:excisionase family DNA binding protein